jgi:hypothetical protein
VPLDRLRSRFGEPSVKLSELSYSGRNHLHFVCMSQDVGSNRGEPSYPRARDSIASFAAIGSCHDPIRTAIVPLTQRLPHHALIKKWFEIIKP